MLFFEVLLFQPRLSFRRREVPEDGVEGSSGLDALVGVSFLTGFDNFWARGPVNLAGLWGSVVDVSVAETSPLVLDLGMNECSPPFFGRDEDINGDTACLVCRVFIGMGLVDSGPLPPS